ncbi:MAG: alpha/beta fold hydrolase [Gordonia sp. (in: high G+C Gram-positive bacteria)]|uniref:RBBP9/YdeN family alpha/beta hydrolase n=2 Tax=Gordoniaceae TaxID=85026 RepID=UPI0032672482
MSRATVVIVPGLRGDAPDHWQERYSARTERSVTVPFPPQQDWHDLAARVDLLDRTVRDVEGPVIVVAHSAGALVTVHWARQGSDAAGKVVGAVLATPPEFSTDWPAPHPRPSELAEKGWAPIPRRRLPFPSVLAASSNDPLADLRVIRGLAEVWGSRLLELGDVGHLNPAAGFGDWPRIDELVAELDAAAAVAR